MKRSVLALTFMLVAAPGFAQTAANPSVDPHAGHSMEQQAPAAATAGPRNPNLPPTGDAKGDNKNAVALDQLKSSPRHVDWVDIKATSGAPIRSFVLSHDRVPEAAHQVRRRTEGLWLRESLIPDPLIPDQRSGIRRYLIEIPPLRTSSVV